MNFRDLMSGALPAGDPQPRESDRQALKLAVLTLMLLGGIYLLGAVTGLAKDKVPTSRTLTGTVFDEAENTIPGATIELTDLQTKKVLDIYSQEDGQYTFAGLRFDHDYTVKATSRGTSSVVRQVSSMDMRWHMVLNLTIPKPKK